MTRLPTPFTGLASALIGLISMLWSFLPLIEPTLVERSLFVSTLAASGAGDEWFAVMLLSGLFLTVTSCMYRRSWRHVSLAVSAVVLNASFWPFAVAGVVTPFTLTLPLMGSYCILILALDVGMKERRIAQARESRYADAYSS